MASLVVHVHDLDSESGTTSPKHMNTTSFSEDIVTNACSPKSEQKACLCSPKSEQRSSCLCSPTTHEGSFRCRLHRSSSGYWGKKPMPTPTPTPTPTATATPAANGGVHQTDQAVEAQRNLADACCTNSLSSDNPTTVQPFQDIVSSS